MIRNIARVAVWGQPMCSHPDPTPGIRSVITVALIVASLLLAVAASAQSYDVSEEKQKRIARLSEIICGFANKNNFHDIKKFLKKAGEHYFGEEITVEEAYPHIRCDESFAPNIDMFRVVVEYPHLELLLLDFLFHFTAEVEDKTLLPTILGCKRDFGYGCLDVYEHIEKRRRMHNEVESMVKKYDFLEHSLWRRTNYGFIRDPKFCREVLDEPPHCQAREKSPEVVTATKAVLALRKQRDEAASHLRDVRRPTYAKGAAFAEVFHGEPSYSGFGALIADIVSYCKRRLGLSSETCEGKHKEFLSRVAEIYMESETLISEAEAAFTRLEARLRERCRNVPEGTHGCGGIARE